VKFSSKKGLSNSVELTITLIHNPFGMLSQDFTKLEVLEKFMSNAFLCLFALIFHADTEKPRAEFFQPLENRKLGG
jgi:hypothetical protein